jgi:hypothetical protein
MKVKGFFVGGIRPPIFTSFDFHHYAIDGGVTVPAFREHFKSGWDINGVNGDFDLQINSTEVNIPTDFNTFIIFYAQDDKHLPINYDVQQRISNKGVGYEWHGMLAVFRKSRDGSVFINMDEGESWLAWVALGEYVSFHFIVTSLKTTTDFLSRNLESFHSLLSFDLTLKNICLPQDLFFTKKKQIYCNFASTTTH